MLDFGHLPKPQNGTIDYFPGFSTTNGGQWEVWNKPRNCMFIRILGIGSGGGGGTGGAANGGDTSAGGGGGGGSGTMTTVTIPASFVPDRLYVSSGVSSQGNGVTSQVCIAPSSANIYVLCYANGGSGGNPGAIGASVGAGGAGGIQAVISTGLQGFQGHFNSIAGQTGGNGGGGNGGNISYLTTGILLSSGSGGGGVSFGVAGSSGNLSSPAQTSAYTLFQSRSGVSSSDGPAGIELYQPLMSCGGVGGAASISENGFNGGNAGFGSGGGGGGGAIAAGALGGKGGKGGPGLVVIHTW
jgi:hypothetical protein